MATFAFWGGSIGNAVVRPLRVVQPTTIAPTPVATKTKVKVEKKAKSKKDKVKKVKGEREREGEGRCCQLAGPYR
jgi:hypothetical protein